MRTILCLILAGCALLWGASRSFSLTHRGIEWAVGKALRGSFTYRTLEWRSRGLIFLDATFSRREEDSLSLHLEAPRIEAAFSFYPFTVFLSLQKPHVALLGQPALQQEENWKPTSIDCRYRISDGTLEWPTFGLKARFSLERTAPWQIGKLTLETGSSQVQLEMFREGSGVRVDAELSRFHLPILEASLRYFGCEITLEQGMADGWVHAEIQESSCNRMVAHLDVREIMGTFYGMRAVCDRALFDWDGPLKDPNRIRCEYSGGSWSFNGCELLQVAGQLSYYADVGMKAECKALGRFNQQEAPIAISSKGFWSQKETPWFEVQCGLSQGLCTFSRKASEWAAQIQHLEPFWGQFALRCASIFYPDLPSFIYWPLGEKVSCLVRGEPNGWELQGLEIADRSYPLHLQMKQGALAFVGGPLPVSSDVQIANLRGNLLLGASEWSFEETSAQLQIGQKTIDVQVMKGSRQRGVLSFDVRASEGYWDLVRLVGEERGGVVAIDPKRTEVFGSSLQSQPWRWGDSEPISLQFDFPAAHLQAVLGSLASSFAGLMHIDASYGHTQGGALRIAGDSFSWREEAYPWMVDMRQTAAGWELGAAWGPLSAECLVRYTQGFWTIKEGSCCLPDQMFFRFEGQSSPSGRGQLQLTEYAMQPRGSFPWPWMASLEGKGCITFDWLSQNFEIDCDIHQARAEVGGFSYTQKKPVHAFFSPAKGLMVQGVSCSIASDQTPSGECSIDLVHFQPSRSLWFLTQTDVHILEEEFPFLKKWGLQDAAFRGDVEFASDFSHVSCFLKEGFFPLGGQMRHVRDVLIHSNERRFACDARYLHQNHDLRIHISTDRACTAGSCVLQEQSDLLTIGWSIDPSFGLSIDSIQGSLGGVDASFSLEEKTEDQCRLIGSAALDFTQLRHWATPSLAEVFTELEMGKGYAVKGALQIDRRDPARFWFQGLFHGKEVELFGYRFRSFFSHLAMEPDATQIDHIKIVDSAGLFTIDRLSIQKEEEWTFTIPLLAISEFRPTLLRTVLGNPGQMSPLVIRQMVFRNVRGIVDREETYTSEGELFFINSYRRERTLFDLPSEILGRLIGLDVELLIPVCGTVRYVLQEGKLRITSLEDAYSEGGRSQFFLVCNDKSPTVDLDGNLHIQLTMKQYVLFKLTEAFGIFIDGKLNHPEYHLQSKKSFSPNLSSAVPLMQRGES